MDRDKEARDLVDTAAAAGRRLVLDAKGGIDWEPIKGVEPKPLDWGTFSFAAKRFAPEIRSLIEQSRPNASKTRRICAAWKHEAGALMSPMARFPKTGECDREAFSGRCVR